jgi:hypothetical protein
MPWSTFGPHPIGTERFVAVSSGTLFVQVAGTILRKQALVQNPDKDEVAAWMGLAVPPADPAPGRGGLLCRSVAWTPLMPPGWGVHRFAGNGGSDTGVPW